MGFSWGQLLFLSLLVSLTNAHRHEYQYCLGSDNYHTGIYEANRLTLLSSLASGTDKYGFYSSSFGENSETVYALVLCRGDIELTTCRSCINSSTGRLIQACPNSKAAFRGNDVCMLPYSNKAMKGIREDNPRKYFVNNASAPSLDQFNQSLRTLLDSLRGEAASGGSRRKFAANETKVHDSLTIYGYMQCTPDLSEHDCDECLRVTTQDLWGCCNGTRKGVTVYKPSCVLWYETFPFLAEISSDEPGNGIPPDAQGNEIPADVPENRSYTNQTAIIIAVPILSITFLLIALACSFLLLRKKENAKRRYNSGSLSNLA